jgi:multidrug transporter EmrE-like cation transporter
MEFIAGIVTIETLGDLSLTKFAQEGGTGYLVGGYTAYGLLLWLFIRAIRTMGLAWSNSAWDGWSNLATGLAAILVMGERPSATELAGMFLITAGLFLLGVNGTARTASKR